MTAAAEGYSHSGYVNALGAHAHARYRRLNGLEHNSYVNALNLARVGHKAVGLDILVI